MNPYGFQKSSEKASTLSSFAKQRMGKSRKSVDHRSMGGSGTRPGFNPFRPVVVGDDEHLVLKGDVLVDEVRRLRIENQIETGAGRNGDNLDDKVSGIQQDVENCLPYELCHVVERLNLGGSKKISGVVDDHRKGLLGSEVSELPDDLMKLNLKDSNQVGDRSFVFASSGCSKDFVFGSSKKNNDMNDSDISTLCSKIEELKMDKSDGAQNELNVKKGEQAFDFGNPRTSSGSRSGSGSGGVIDSMILDEIERLKIGNDSDLSKDSSDRDQSTRREGGGTLNHPKFSSLFGESGKHSSGSHVHQDPELHQSSFPSTGLHFQSVREEFQAPSVDGTEKKPGLDFGFKQDASVVPPVEFRTPRSLFTGSNQNIKFNAKNKDNLSKGRTGKLKEPTSVLQFWKNFSQIENNLQECSQPTEFSSPMDVSPCPEIQEDKQSIAETWLISEDQTSTASISAYSDDLIDEDLVRATECMDINKENDMKYDDANVQVSLCSVSSSDAMSGSLENPLSDVETEYFNPAPDNVDTNDENEVESVQDSQNYQTQCFSAPSSVSGGGGLSFTFAASSSVQGQASSSMRHQKKKSHMKAGSEIYIPARTAVLSNATSSMQFSPIPRVTPLPSPRGEKDVISAVLKKEGDNLKAFSGRESASRAAQEACEKWRLRGNQSYSNGDLETAENYYSQGLSCIPHNEISSACQRAMVLCYSNRAATRMSLGRMRDALQDCLVASEIDPSFFRVQLRAANCYLALGEVGDASRYFKRFMESNDVCVDRKLILEASDGIRKAQKVSECMERSAKHLQQRTFNDVESALGVIAEALVISPYSEQLLEYKAAALFTFRRYEEVMQLCKKTFEAAEKNSSLLDASGQLSNLEASEILKYYSFRIWRYYHIFKSNFCLGKLEEALDFLDKQEQWRSMVNKYGNDKLESFIPQVSTARELIRHKCAGNEAFQVGRHTEAVDHYTAALSFNVESHPFAAVCFGNRAAAYQALGQITDAIADCSLAIALDGNYSKAISRRANLFGMIRDYEQAAKDLQRLVSLFTKQAEEKANGSSLTNCVADLRQARQRLFQMEEQARKGLPLNFYQILGVEATVTAAVLKKAYRKSALRHHPDKAGQSLARSESGDDGLWKEVTEEVYKDADRLFKMIGEAYAILSDPTKRSQYDIEEETRNGQRKTSVSSVSRMNTDAPFYTTERGGGSARQWHEVGKSSTNPYYRGFEPTKSNRYY